MSDLEKHPDPVDPEAVVDEILPQWGAPWLRAMAAFAVGGAVLQTGLTILGVHLEWFLGLATFNGSWVLAMTILPVGAGVLIGVIYGYGGKYLAHFPPLTVLLLSYYQSVHTPLPADVELLPWGLWVMFVILQMEFCAVGGFIGEILIRRKTGWRHRYGASLDAESLPVDASE